MAPKAGTKRAAPANKGTQPTKAQKKMEGNKVEEVPQYSDPLVEGLVDAVQRADLPAGCKDMLIPMIPGSFCAFVEERHELQGMVVRMVGEIIEEMHADLTKRFDEASIAVEAAESKRVELVRAVEEAENLLSKVKETVLSKGNGLQEAVKAVAEKQELLDSNKETQKKAEEELGSVRAEQEIMVSSVSEKLNLLCSSNFDEHAAMQHFEVMQPYIAKLELEQSLLLALPGTCQKKPSERGAFGNVVMDQLKQALQARISNLEGTIANAGVAAAERAAATQAAEEELSSAKQAHGIAEQDLAAVKTQRQEATECLKRAKQAVSDITYQVDAAGKVRSEKDTCRGKFERWNMSCFIQLRYKSLASREVQESLEPPLAEPAIAEPAIAEAALAVVPIEAAASDSKEMTIGSVGKTLVCQAGA